MARVDPLLRYLKESGGSDLHLAAGQSPLVRLHGRLEPIPNAPVLSHEQVLALLVEVLAPKQREAYERTGDLDFAFGLEGVARFRTNYLLQESGAAAVFRIIPDHIPALADLKMPPALETLAQLRSGLIFVTGPTGSGKSTTLAALVDRINETYPRHIVTVEDPVEFIHKSKKSVVSQRQVGFDTASFAAALRGAIRQDAEVIMVGEMRDAETIGLAVSAAEMGSLVLGTLHTNSAAKTIERVIDAFPPDQQPQVRASLAESLQGVVSQLLLRRADGRGRVAAVEILMMGQGLSSMIREGKTNLLDSVIVAGKKVGMQSMDDALWALAEAKAIEPDEAYLKAKDKKRFESLVPSETS